MITRDVVKITGLPMDEVLLALYNKAILQGKDDTLVSYFNESFPIQKLKTEAEFTALKNNSVPYDKYYRDYISGLERLARSLRWRGRTAESKPGNIERVRVELAKRRSSNPPNYNFDNAFFGGAPRTLKICFTGEAFDEFDPTQYDELHSEMGESGYAKKIIDDLAKQLKDQSKEECKMNRSEASLKRPSTPLPFFSSVLTIPPADGVSAVDGEHPHCSN